MNLDSRQIDLIVNEVVRRLTARELPAAASESLPAVAASGWLAIDDRVVTMQSVAGRLDGITQVCVGQKAIVTPMVTDTLREQGIQLARRSTPPQYCLVPSVILVTCDSTRRRVQSLLDRLSPAWTFEPNLERALKSAAESPAGPRVLVLTAAWARVVCDVNRHASMRAASVLSLPMARQAIEQVDPNVFVLDPSELNAAELQALISECLASRRNVA